MVNTSPHLAVELDFLQEIVHVHWNTKKVYVELNCVVNVYNQSLTPPAPATAVVTPRNGAELIYTAPPSVFTNTNPNETWFVYTTPRQTILYWGVVDGAVVPVDRGVKAGYDTFADFLSAYDAGHNPDGTAVNGGAIGSIPPESGPIANGVAVPGFDPPMTAKQHAIAFSAYVNSLPDGGSGRVPGFPYTAPKGTYDVRRHPVSFTSTSLQYILSVPGPSDKPIADFTVNGFGSGPADSANAAGFVYSTLKKAPTDTSSLPFPADWEIITSGRIPSTNSYTFTVTKPKVLPTDPGQEGKGPYVISAPGLTGF